MTMNTSTNRSFIASGCFWAGVLFALTPCCLNGQTDAGTNAAPGRGARGGFGGFGGRGGPPPPWIEAGYNDHQNMMSQVGVKALRPGKNGRNQTGPGFDE